MLPPGRLRQAETPTSERKPRRSGRGGCHTEGEAFNYRYDYHPRPDCPEKHFHEPPAADHDAVLSCIEVEQVQLVTLAVLQCWRDAVESGDVSNLQQPNPP
ncbi:hypothetical protein SAMN05216559_1832 [Halomicrobium zhouii]|uniref:Uncharacterized protein n=1 Tax=Halomicrobium zhouii TaxID=767519 RepID=A0A1I6L1E7_9EURY|nr:hypothetical protein SAMN05216559_1832 [Halomicrobium zhouii]